MKRNMVPLLGIAFVAAVVATGVVYGLFGGRLRAKAPEMAGQSIVVAARDLDRGTVLNPETNAASGGVAAGMRAVSIRVSESSGLMGLLHTGSRVDLQAVTDRNGAAELRTILQNVEVMHVSPQLEP